MGARRRKVARSDEARSPYHVRSENLAALEHDHVLHRTDHGYRCHDCLALRDLDPMDILNCGPSPIRDRNRRVLAAHGRLSPGRVGDTDHSDRNEGPCFDRRGDHALKNLAVEYLVHA